MAIENPRPAWRFTLTGRWLHWIMAVFILFQLGLGWYMMSVEDRPGGARDLFSLHKSVGLALLVLVTVRVCWRLLHPVAPLPGYVPRWQRMLAGVTEWSLYACMIAMPVLGYLGASHQKQAPRFFGLPTPSWGAPDHELAERLFGIHGIVGWVLAALIALHVAGALMHIVIDRDGVFHRMSLGRDRETP